MKSSILCLAMARLSLSLWRHNRIGKRTRASLFNEAAFYFFIIGIVAAISISLVSSALSLAVQIVTKVKSESIIGPYTAPTKNHNIVMSAQS
jgi:hypothetical protein